MSLLRAPGLTLAFFPLCLSGTRGRHVIRTSACGPRRHLSASVPLGTPRWELTQPWLSPWCISGQGRVQLQWRSQSSWQ